MTVLKILSIPDTRLRTIAIPVKKIDYNIQNIINNMFDTMYTKSGIGLAATQVNIHQCIVVIDISSNQNERLVLINPKLIEKSGEIETEEGCLSVPEQRANITRAEKVTISAYNLKGHVFELQADGLLAICIQHEMDHLVGKLFIDYLSALKQQRIYKKIEKLNRLRFRKLSFMC